MAYAIERKNMKRILVVIMIVLGIIFCSACGNNEKENDMIEHEIGNYHNKNWNEDVGTYKKDVVPDKETALKIAKAIFDGMEKSKDAQEYVPQCVFYDTLDKIWIVSFWKDWEESNEITIGGNCSIAIQKKDGKVLRIWFGE